MERSVVEATEVPFRTSKPIRRFTTLCSPIFDEGLRGYGFKRTAKKIERHSYSSSTDAVSCPATCLSSGRSEPR